MILELRDRGQRYWIALNLDRGSYDLPDVDAGGLLIWGLGPNSGSLQEQYEILVSQPSLWPQV